MKTLKEIRLQYSLANEEIRRQEQFKESLLLLYKVVKKMKELTYESKWSDMIIFDQCPEYGKKKGDIHLAFCIERCTPKCKDYSVVAKKYPKLIRYVQDLNARYAKLVHKIEELKRY